MQAAKLAKLKIYHDGNCPFCRWSQQKVERWDVERRLDFRDYNVSAAETPYTFDELSSAMRLQTPDGRWHTGYFAWIEILRAVPSWRWLGRLLALVPFRWIGPAVYRLIANNRYRIPRFLLRWLGAPRVCDEACAIG